jgi:phosphatidylglycerophosphate synthase
MERGNLTGVYLSLGTLVGAFLISYARARAEGLGESCHTGIMERPERIVLLAFATITGWIIPILWIMFVLTHVTVLQRIYHVRRQMSR